MIELNDFIVLLPCAAALVIGFLVKNTISVIPNKYIPLICGVIGLVINIWINWSFSPEILVSGLVSGVAATGMFELVRNLIGGKTNEEESK